MTIKKIITLQKRAIRTINKVWYRSHTEPLFKSNQIQKFEDMYTMQISLFVYDLNNDLLPKSFRNLLSQNYLARHGIITRQNNLIPQSRPRTTFSSKLPKHNFTRIWNKGHATRNDIVDDIVDFSSSTMAFNVAKVASARASLTISLTKSLRVAGPLDW